MQESRNPINQLMDEHILIEKLCSLLLKAVEKVEKRESVNPAVIKWMVHFLDFYVDHLHHTKEEEILFKKLENHGLFNDAGPIACMLGEHHMGREYIVHLKELTEQPSFLDKNSSDKFIHLARGYLGLLGEHIFKENNILYPAIQNMLSADELFDIAVRFEHLDAFELSAGRLEEIKLMMSLIEQQFCEIPPTNKEIL